MNLIMYNICIKKYVRIVLMNALKGIIIYIIWKECIENDNRKKGIYYKFQFIINLNIINNY